MNRVQQRFAKIVRRRRSLRELALGAAYHVPGDHYAGCVTASCMRNAVELYELAVGDDLGL
ncbi:hypothetical protein [Sphaerisporangium album]|uniref:hypothetical protein n=1 Tax=Sphaerisporangium album TaxID=509200 RepID=UPI0011C073C6|nr:hypothetical protein [Sphaerisporangium album]